MLLPPIFLLFWGYSLLMIMDMDIDQFRQHAHDLVDWMADYLTQVEQYPVKAQVQPREIYNQLPDQMPMDGEPMEQIMADFERVLMPGMTHWQHPGFHAYFPANSSPPSILGEMLMTTLGAQCMVWETSPAAAELEERVLEWLRDAMHLPPHWTGVIQDTASTATLTALLSAREQATNYRSNKTGLGKQTLRVYCSEETHSSIEKAVKIAGLGSDNLIYLPTNADLSVQPAALEAAIIADLEAGYQPLCVVALIGSTSTTAVDSLAAIADICQRYNLWLHVDAAFAGVALLLPEYAYLLEGMEQADSFVTNAHKWLFTNFDCSLYYVKDKEVLIQTFEILPEYLKTATHGAVNDYRDWGIPLGRRFRALKLWWVLRTYGLSGLRKMMSHHLEWTRLFAQWVTDHPDFEVLAPVPFSLVCFRYAPQGASLEAAPLNALNERLLQALNATGEVYLTHTRIRGQYALRLVVAQTYVKRHHVERVWTLVQEHATKLRPH